MMDRRTHQALLLRGEAAIACVTLDTGARIELGPQATADQLRTVIENVR